MPEKQSHKHKPDPGRASKWWITFAALILLLGGVLFYVQAEMQPPNNSGTAVAFEVASGSGASEIGDALKEKGLIKNATLFKWYLAFEGSSSQLKAGKYYLTQGMSMEEIANVLVGGDAKFGTNKVTIPEGYTVEQIADLLAEKKIVDKQAFLEEADHGTFDYSFLKDIPAEGLTHRLEGYLFPDTYELFQAATAHEIIDMMLKQTSAVLTAELQEQIKQNGYTVHETLTMASLVEREAAAAQERPMIAGVIYNRLKAQPPMMLQIDATIQYALGKQKEKLLFSDLEIESPYNTYKHDGLPPGPIASPGRDSIQAVVKPAVHDFYFYVTKNDGTGEHYFSKTFAEHEENIRKSGT